MLIAFIEKSGTEEEKTSCGVLNLRTGLKFE